MWYIKGTKYDVRFVLLFCNGYKRAGATRWILRGGKCPENVRCDHNNDSCTPSLLPYSERRHTHVHDEFGRPPACLIVRFGRRNVESCLYNYYDYIIYIYTVVFIVYIYIIIIIESSNKPLFARCI